MSDTASASPIPLRDDGDPHGATLVMMPLDTPARAHGTVLVLPGGGYQMTAAHEAEPVAEFFRQRGFHAAVLRYRVAPHHRHPAPLHDAQRAARMIRADARFGGAKLAVLGFSAGGHLAATLATHGDANADPADALVGLHPARPDAAVLCYPVVQLFGPHAHGGSGENLLGTDAPMPHEPPLNLEDAVTPQTCPTFCWHTADDASVPAMNSIVFAQACWQHGVPCELHVFTDGKHGLGLASDHAPASVWPALAAEFLSRQLA